MTRMNTQKLSIQFAAKQWTEAVVHELADAGKISQANISNTLCGDLEGEGFLSYVLSYAAVPGSDVPFMGYERVVGRMAEREGSFVLQHVGMFSVAIGVQGRLTVVPGSGTGGFSTLSGGGEIVALPGAHGGHYALELSGFSR